MKTRSFRLDEHQKSDAPFFTINFACSTANSCAIKDKGELLTRESTLHYFASDTDAVVESTSQLNFNYMKMDSMRPNGCASCRHNIPSQHSTNAYQISRISRLRLVKYSIDCLIRGRSHPNNSAIYIHIHINANYIWCEIFVESHFAEFRPAV